MSDDLQTVQAEIAELEATGADAGAISRARASLFALQTNVMRAEMGQEIESPADDSARVQRVDKGKAGLDYAGPADVAESHRWIEKVSRAVDPFTGRPYVHATNADGQATREAVFAGRVAVMRGETIPSAQRQEVEAWITANEKTFAEHKAAKDAADLAKFREQNQ